MVAPMSQTQNALDWLHFMNDATPPSPPPAPESSHPELEMWEKSFSATSSGLIDFLPRKPKRTHCSCLNCSASNTHNHHEKGIKWIQFPIKECERVTESSVTTDGLPLEVLLSVEVLFPSDPIRPRPTPGLVCHNSSAFTRMHFTMTDMPFI